jgi:hypothetical protein
MLNHFVGIPLWGILDDFVRLFRITVSYPLQIIGALLACWVIYRIFRYMGFNQRRSILLSEPYLNGEYYESMLRAGVADPHQFYLQEVGLLMRPAYCNVCSQRMIGISERAMCCDVCGYATHERCISFVVNNCKSISLLPTPRHAAAFTAALHGISSDPAADHSSPATPVALAPVSSDCSSRPCGAGTAALLRVDFGDTDACPDTERAAAAQALALASPADYADAFLSALASAPARCPAAASAPASAMAVASLALSLAPAAMPVSPAAAAAAAPAVAAALAARLQRALSVHVPAVWLRALHTQDAAHHYQQQQQQLWQRSRSRSQSQARSKSPVQSCAQARVPARAGAGAGTRARRPSRTRAETGSTSAAPADVSAPAPAPATEPGPGPVPTPSARGRPRAAAVAAAAAPVPRRRSARSRACAEPEEQQQQQQVLEPAPERPRRGGRVATGAGVAAKLAAAEHAAAAKSPVPHAHAHAQAESSAVSASAPASAGEATSPQPHHWSRGNHSTVSDVCLVCGEVTGSLFALAGLHCLWCRANVHEGCVAHLREHDHDFCRRGPLTRLILPPHAAFPAPGYTAATARLAIAALKRSQPAAAAAAPAAAAAVAEPAVGPAPAPIRALTVADLFSAPAAVGSAAAVPVAAAPWDPLTAALCTPTPSSSSSSSNNNSAGDGDASGLPASAVVSVCLPPVSVASLPPGDPLLTTPLVWRFALPPEVTPLLVFINRKSGGNVGIQLMHEFTELLNPLQVWDLSEYPPEVALALFSTVPRLQVIVCGGDGTVSWVLSAIDKLNRPVPVAVMPLGTGNDLAQVLGWGRTAPDVDGGGLLPTLRRVGRAGICVLDRWDVKVKALPPDGGDPAEADTAAATAAAAASAAETAQGAAVAGAGTTAGEKRVRSGVATPRPRRVRPVAAAPALPEQSASVLAPVVEDEEDDEIVFEPPPESCWQRLKMSPLVRRVSAIFPIISPSPRGSGPVSAVVNNYLGVGLDAVIAHKFHLLRSNYPHFFTSQLLNKLWYTRLGTEAYFFPHAPNVIRDSQVQLFVDGVGRSCLSASRVALRSLALT